MVLDRPIRKVEAWLLEHYSWQPITRVGEHLVYIRRSSIYVEQQFRGVQDQVLQYIFIIPNSPDRGSVPSYYSSSRIIDEDFRLLHVSKQPSHSGFRAKDNISSCWQVPNRLVAGYTLFSECQRAGDQRERQTRTNPRHRILGSGHSNPLRIALRFYTNILELSFSLHASSRAVARVALPTCDNCAARMAHRPGKMRELGPCGFATVTNRLRIVADKKGHARHNACPAGTVLFPSFVDRCS
jgi:hypothetical protein